ncbi:hypothetical protein CC85DRAFT_278029 [Cutaneotrichosporon oleaginosum]|uniref:t-SNARE coiled-coil homology domain-containing protein n=1 Tax=Cutaneotrichosporon oleaginosum TaxID=879819 RepID=A0A0J0XGW4_9TREE|nr:uncharacterized protein CC85DRAFT_278029 [Cutaneotrichosporon oleaginosum]KLT40306.1 hypothetical protein CC85DRAFT_278029 [Cutaneotrichosporon oleaginosum]TXT07982.1 hypothetical protein COLE_04906 [Cutaneotrichosporon oleaginosum]
MVYIDQTGAFHKLVAQNSKSANSSPGSSRPHSRASSRHRQQRTEEDDGFLNEAYQIYGHLSDLGRLLKTVRKPYLSTAEPPPISRRGRTAAANGDDDELRRFENSKYLSERERDEIEVRAKMILRRCRERVTMLEEAEKRRKDKVAPPQPMIFNWLPSLAPLKEDSAEPLIAAHRGTIIWTLNDMLAKLSATQTGMQEERAKRRDERNRTLGGGAAREAAQLQVAAERSGNGIMPIPAAALNITPADEPAIEEQLSAHQLQQFESENNALLEHMESQLSSVLAAEKSLLEISAMQTELVRHLVQQTEIIDRLYDEAVGSVSEMGKANKQLKRAKERSGEARLMLLVFLIGATFSLLFLNWYS